MYTGDLSEILRTLKETEASGVIYTEGMSPGGPWQAELTLFKGQVTSCQVRSSEDGRSLLTDYEALRWLASLGYLIWKRVTSTPKQNSPLHDSQATLLQSYEVPRRLAPAEQVGMHSWSRKQRQVFALVDGRRSTERIAAILCQPLSVVGEILYDLQAKGVIAVNRVHDELRGEEEIVWNLS
jgi:hypothetical protein